MSGVIGLLQLPDDFKERVKKAIQRLHNKGVIERVGRGKYQIKIKEEEGQLGPILDKEEPRVHYLHLVGIQGTGLLESEEGYPIIGTRDTRDRIRDTDRDGIRRPLRLQTTLDTWEVEGNKMVCKRNWRGRDVRIESSPARVEVILSSSKKSLCYPELDAFFSWLEGWFDPLDFYEIQWEKMNVGLCIDSVQIALKGVSEVTFKEWRNEIRRWYVKKGLQPYARRETHATIYGATIAELIENLKGKEPLGLGSLIERMDTHFRLHRDHTREHKEMRAIIDKLLLVIHDQDPQRAIVRYG
ncbi:MAG: hypothetical protein ACE5KV_04270 [Thermoplasmata archaeon]